MRILILVLFPLFSFAQINFFTSLFNSYYPVGVLKSELFATSSGWTVSGTNDYSFASKLSISGSNTAAFDKFITKDNSDFNYRTYNLNFTFTVKDISAGSTGFGVGFKSFNSLSSLSSMIECNTQSGTLNLFFTNQGNYNVRTQFTGATNFAVSVNDVITVNYDNQNSYGLLTVTKGGVTRTYTGVNEFLPNNAKLAVWSLGGTHEINSIVLSSSLKVNSDIVFIGNSITTGGNAGTHPNHYTYKVGQYVNFYSVCSGSGDRTQDVLLSLPRILLLKPKKVVLMIGTNNLGQGIANSTTIADITSIRSQLMAIGTTVFICKITPRNTIDVTTLNALITSNFTNVINTYTPLVGSGTSLNATYDVGDGIHPNAAGHTVISNSIKSALGL